MNKLILRALLHALGVTAYIGIIIAVIQNIDNIHGKLPNIVGPAAMLMLFVLSAAITGSLVLGKPILMYLDNQRKEAIQLFLYTLGWLAIETVILMAITFGLS